MATADTSAGDGGPQCARDFVQERLREADSAMSPADLAEEYDCTNGHIRNLLADLRSEGAVQRVGHGEYVAAVDDGDGEPADLQADLQPESEGNAQEETDDTPPDETAQETPEPVAGPARSEDPDTTGGSPVEIEGDERADVDLSGSEDDDGYGVEDDRADDRAGVPTGWVIVGGCVLLAVVVLLSSMDGPDEPGENVDDEPEPDTDQPNTAQWGAE